LKRYGKYAIFGMAKKKTIRQEKGGTGAGEQLSTTRLFPRPVIWVGSSKDDISALPAPVKASLSGIACDRCKTAKRRST
jgi:hypothetical protein